MFEKTRKMLSICKFQRPHPEESIEITLSYYAVKDLLKEMEEAEKEIEQLRAEKSHIKTRLMEFI